MQGVKFGPFHHYCHAGRDRRYTGNVMSSMDTSTIAVMTSECGIILEFGVYLNTGVHLEEKKSPM
jgi:hypothetical protein